MTDAHDRILVHGARENNLKNVSVEIPKRRLTVFTGVSGSGKSSLVFDTIAAESQRLINETYSAFVQGFMPAMARPDVDVPDHPEGEGEHHEPADRVVPDVAERGRERRAVAGERQALEERTEGEVEPPTDFGHGSMRSRMPSRHSLMYSARARARSSIALMPSMTLERPNPK